MQPHNVISAFAGTTDRRDRKRRRVGGQNRIVMQYSFEIAKKRALDGQVLNDRLDHQVAFGECSQLHLAHTTRQ